MRSMGYVGNCFFRESEVYTIYSWLAETVPRESSGLK